MSLNRYEQLLFDYLESHPDEKRFWESRVLDVSRNGDRREAQVLELNRILWEYFEERARFETEFEAATSFDGSGKISMLNLSEYLLRMWAPLPKKRARQQG